MELDGEESCEVREILIGCQDRELPSDGHGADQEIGVRALDSARSASVEEGGRFLVVVHLQFDIWEGSQILTESLILLLRGNAGQDLLSDGPDDRSATLSNEICKLTSLGFVRGPSAAKGKRPDRGIDDYAHGRRRWRL